MSQTAPAPLTVDGAPLYKALAPHQKDQETQGVHVVVIDPDRSTANAPYVRILPRHNGPQPIVGPADSGLLDTGKWRLVPLTGRNRQERELYELFQRLHEDREAARQARLETFWQRRREIDRDGPAIVRSSGIPIEGTPYHAGGGYTGATNELDATVLQAAQLLLETYGLDVQIRFNSDRKSGGAFVVTDATDSAGGNAEIGLGAQLVDVAKTRASLADLHGDAEQGDRELQASLEAGGQDPDNPPASYLKITVLVGSRALKDPTKASGDRGALHAVAPSLAEGLAIVRDAARHPRDIAPKA